MGRPMSEEKDRSGAGHGETPNDRLPRLPKLNYSELGDAALIDAMRASDRRAIDEFIIRYQRLLFDRARNAGILRGDCEDHIIEVVEEVAILIVTHRVRPTKALGAYVVKCFFNRLADVVDDAKRRRRIVQENTEDAPARGERAVMGLVSEDAIRSSHGPDWECVPLSEPLRRLASMIEEGLSAEDEQLLAWQSRFVPLRQIASWLGISYAAAAQRSWRLRERLRATATQYAFNLSPKERRVIADFFDRCAVTYDRHLRSGTDDDSPPPSA
jgi:DNA-directed RNA polymerase specialized sigma24 family protein